jgi:hypothetical protein
MAGLGLSALIYLFVKSFNLVYFFVGYFFALFLLYLICQAISGGCKSGGFRMDRIQGFLLTVITTLYLIKLTYYLGHIFYKI